MSEKIISFADITRERTVPDTTEATALRAIQWAGRGWAFSQRDFARLGSRDAIDKALQRLAQRGTIRRAIRGIYDYPRISSLLDQELSPELAIRLRCWDCRRRTARIDPIARLRTHACVARMM